MPFFCVNAITIAFRDSAARGVMFHYVHCNLMVMWPTRAKLHLRPPPCGGEKQKVLSAATAALPSCAIKNIIEA